MSERALDDSPDSLPRVVNAIPLTPQLRWARARKALAHIGDKTLSIAIFSIAMVGFLVPPAVFFISGLWGSITFVSSVVTLWREISTWRLADMFTSLATVDTSGGFALAGVSYFALIFSFIVLFGGLLGHRWQRIFVMPGILLCAPSVIIFTFAATLSFSVIASRLLLPKWLEYPLIGYALLNALMLAVMLLDLRPSRRHRRLARHLHRRKEIIDDVDGVSSTPLPIVRFGPSQPPVATGVSGTSPQPAVALVPPSPALSSEADATPVGLSPAEVVAETVADAASESLLALHQVETITETPAESEPVVATSNLAP